MLRRERGVKWLDAKSARVALEALARHERDRAEPADIAVVKIAAVVEMESERGVRSFRGRQRTATEEEGAGEPWLDDEAVAGIEVQHDELGAAPATEHRGASKQFREICGRDLTEYVGPRDQDVRDAPPANLTVEVASNGFGLWKLRQGSGR